VTRAVRVAFLTLVWVGLWSDLSLANVVGGVAVATIVTMVMPPWRPGHVAVRPLAVVRFVAFFSVQLVKASLVVARTLVSPSGRIHAGIVAVPLRGASDAVATVTADAVSLTPGTLTLEVRGEPPTLYVHALDLRDVDQVRADIRRLELLAVRAFGSTDALAGLEHDDTETWRTP